MDKRSELIAGLATVCFGILIVGLGIVELINGSFRLKGGGQLAAKNDWLGLTVQFAVGGLCVLRGIAWIKKCRTEK